MVKIFERDRGFSDADDFLHPHAAGFVAHVGGIGQVVGAIEPREELIEKGCFVAGSAGRIKNGFVGIIQRIEMTSEGVEGFFPRDRAIMCPTRVLFHRPGEPSLLAQPEVGLLA